MVRGGEGTRGRRLRGDTTRTAGACCCGGGRHEMLEHGPLQCERGVWRRASHGGRHWRRGQRRRAAALVSSPHRRKRAPLGGARVHIALVTEELAEVCGHGLGLRAKRRVRRSRRGGRGEGPGTVVVDLWNNIFLIRASESISPGCRTVTPGGPTNGSQRGGSPI
jgi:hypothetical protein